MPSRSAVNTNSASEAAPILLHHPSAMLLDGFFRSSQLGADLLIQQPGRDQCKHLALPRGQSLLASVQFAQLRSEHCESASALDRRSNASSSAVRLNGFSRKSTAPPFIAPVADGISP